MISFVKSGWIFDLQKLLLHTDCIKESKKLLGKDYKTTINPIDQSNFNVENWQGNWNCLFLNHSLSLGSFELFWKADSCIKTWISGLECGASRWGPTLRGTTRSRTRTWWRAFTTRRWSSRRSWRSRTRCLRKTRKFWPEMTGKKIQTTKFKLWVCP